MKATARLPLFVLSLSIASLSLPTACKKDKNPAPPAPGHPISKPDIDRKLNNTFNALKACKKDKNPAPPAPPAAPTATPTVTLSPTRTLTQTRTLTFTRTSTPTTTSTPTLTRTRTLTPIRSATPYPTSTCGASAVTLGTTIGAYNIYSSSNHIHCTRQTLSGTHTLRTLSVWIANIQQGVSIRLGIYSEVSGRPSVLLAQTAYANATTGVNTLPVLSPVSLLAGNYWIATSVAPTTASYVYGDAYATPGYSCAIISPAAGGDLPSPLASPTTFTGVGTSHWGILCP